MLKKLFKYEFSYMSRTVPFGYLILIAFAIVNRGLQSLADSNDMFLLAESLSVLTLMLITYAVLLLPTIMLIVRFYKSVVGDEGYLSFTLPVSASQLLVSKLLNAFVWTFFSCVAIALEVLISSVGFVDYAEAFRQIFGALGQLEAADPLLFWIIAVELFLLVIVVPIANFCQIYASMSIGQLAKKHKILGSIGAYIGINVVESVITSIITGAITMSVSVNAELEYAFDYFSVMALVGIFVLFYAAVGTALFLTSRYILSKKLNLE